MGSTDAPERPAGQAPAALLSELAELAYFEVDADRNVVALSPAMERLTGFRAEDILGRSCLRLHRCDECLQGCGVFDAGTVRDRRLELYAADGSTIRVSKSGQVFFDEDGNVTGAVEVVKLLDEERAMLPVSPSPEASAPAAAVVGRFFSPAEAAEAERIRGALSEARYRRTDAARALGISRATLWRKMKQYGI